MLELLTDSHIDLAVSGARHGEGLFETIRIRAGAPLRLAAHLERLAAGARFLDLDAPPDLDQVLGFLGARTCCCGLANGVLHLVALDRHLQVTVAPWEPAPPGRVALGVSGATRRYSGNPLNRFKTLSYLENRLLAREAERLGLFEVIAGNERGRLTDGSRTNLFLVKGGRLVTPPVADGALPGVARRVLLEAGLAQEAPLVPQDLENAEAILLTNSLRGGLPVHGLQGQSRALDVGHDLLTRAMVLLG